LKLPALHQGNLIVLPNPLLLKKSFWSIAQKESRKLGIHPHGIVLCFEFWAIHRIGD
jgi:hypothetical protein